MNSRQISNEGMPFALAAVVDGCIEYEIVSEKEGWGARGICVEDILLE